jgi:ABC-type transport system involved in multi-copper enzyme maturation permease subunit
MLWYKSWLELRFRLVCVLLVLFSQACFGWFAAREIAAGEARATKILTATGSGAMQGLAQQEAAAFASGMFLMAVAIAPVTALILAGAGMNTQTSYGMTPGFHGSMLYTLSLPVTRRQLLWTRAGLGALFYGIYLVLSVVVLVLVSPLGGVPVSFQNAIPYLPGLLAGSSFYYGLSVLLTAVFDEFWSSIAGFFIIGLASGYSIGGRASAGNLLALMQGSTIHTGQEWPWLAAFLWAACGVALVHAASLWLERREV